MKKLLVIFIFFLFDKFSFSQTTSKYHTTKISGYRIWELGYDSITKRYISKHFYLLSDSNQFSELSNTHSSAKLCDDKKLMRKSVGHRRIKTDAIDKYYYFSIDTLTENVLIKGTFYEADSGILCLAYKIYAKVIVIDNLCAEFENSRRGHGRCGTYIKSPYILTLKTIRTESISKKDREKFGWSESAPKTIKWVDCH